MRSASIPVLSLGFALLGAMFPGASAARSEIRFVEYRVAPRGAEYPGYKVRVTDSSVGARTEVAITPRMRLPGFRAVPEEVELEWAVECTREEATQVMRMVESLLQTEQPEDADEVVLISCPPPPKVWVSMSSARFSGTRQIEPISSLYAGLVGEALGSLRSKQAEVRRELRNAFLRLAGRDRVLNALAEVQATNRSVVIEKYRRHLRNTEILGPRRNAGRE